MPPVSLPPSAASGHVCTLSIATRGICCSGGREAGLGRGWPVLGTRGICCSGGREAGLGRGGPVLGTRGICCSGGREAGLGRGGPVLGTPGPGSPEPCPDGGLPAG